MKANTSKTIIVLIVILTSLFFTCRNSKFELLDKTLNQIDTNLKNYDLIVVIPNEGCGGCISNCTTYMVDNIDSFKQKVAVVFTGVRDMKLFKLQIDTTFLRRKNILVDDKNLFLRDEISSIYPQTIRLINKKTSSIDVFDESYFEQEF